MPCNPSPCSSGHDRRPRVRMSSRQSLHMKRKLSAESTNRHIALIVRYGRQIFGHFGEAGESNCTESTYFLIESSLASSPPNSNAPRSAVSQVENRFSLRVAARRWECLRCEFEGITLASVFELLVTSCECDLRCPLSLDFVAGLLLCIWFKEVMLKSGRSKDGSSSISARLAVLI